MLQHKHENQEEKGRQVHHELISYNGAASVKERFVFMATCAGRFRSIPAIKSGMLIGLARNGCPWIRRPDLASASSPERSERQSVFCVMSDRISIRAATSPPSVS